MISAATGWQRIGCGQQHRNRGHRAQPGKMPISVPKIQPIKQYIRFCAVKATLKPKDKCSINSTIQISCWR